jgi:SepF-like predicted cell division protein (DUF552 family)
LDSSKPSEASSSSAETAQGEFVSPRRITYVKALPLRDLSDVAQIKEEVESGNILIVRIAPLAMKSVDDVKRAINELREYITSIKDRPYPRFYKNLERKRQRRFLGWTVCI